MSSWQDFPCDGAYGQGPFWGLDWREIQSWCPIEWEILGNKFLARGIVPQEPWDIWDERCTSLHWDLGGRTYEGWIQCLLMGLIGSLQDAPCFYTTQGSGGCILTSAILRLIWDPGITMTGSLVIARGCFRRSLVMVPCLYRGQLLYLQEDSMGYLVMVPCSAMLGAEGATDLLG